MGKGVILVAAVTVIAIIGFFNHDAIADFLVIDTVNVGVFPEFLAYDSGKGEVFVSNVYSNTISVISDSTNEVVATIDVYSNPFGVAYDPAKGEIFVANDSSGAISIISDSTNTVVATINVAGNPWEIVYDS